MEENSIVGTLKVFDAAAEETEGAKIYMSRDGLFNELDTCLHLHHMSLTSPFHARFVAVSMLLIDFEGRCRGYYAMTRTHLFPCGA